MPPSRIITAVHALRSEPSKRRTELRSAGEGAYRAPLDNSPVIDAILAFRNDIDRLLGRPHSGDCCMATKMATVDSARQPRAAARPRRSCGTCAPSWSAGAWRARCSHGTPPFTPTGCARSASPLPPAGPAPERNRRRAVRSDGAPVARFCLAPYARPEELEGDGGGTAVRLPAA